MRNLSRKSLVSQGLTFGPPLLLTYMNDLSHSLSSNLKLFTDDNLLFSVVHNRNQPGIDLNHPRFNYFKSKMLNLIFCFENTYNDVVMKVINNLNVNKSCQMNDILPKVVKMNNLISLGAFSITVMLMVDSVIN